MKVVKRIACASFRAATVRERFLRGALILLLTFSASAQNIATQLAANDATLRNQNGDTVHFYADLVKGKIVAINSIFTTCTTICPPMGANFAALRKLLGNRAGAEVNLISVSVDPITDTPERLKAWSEKFGAGPGWTLLTGQKSEVDRLLKILGSFTPDKQDHSPVLLLGNDATGEWIHVSGLAAPAKIAEVISTLQPTQASSAAQKYFTDVELVDQDGRRSRLYSDLLKDKVVVINTFFTTCDATCPMLSAAFVKIQKWLGEKLGKEVYLISISVDPDTDTPPKLKEYAAKFAAQPGWLFLTGDKKNVDFALAKFGQVLVKKNDHLNLFYIGNVKTGLWKKVFGLANADELIKAVESVSKDQG